MSYIEALNEIRESRADLDYSLISFVDEGNFAGTEFIKIKIKDVVFNGDDEYFGDRYFKALQEIERFCLSHELNLFGNDINYNLPNHALYQNFFLTTGVPERLGYGELLPLNKKISCSCGEKNNGFGLTCNFCRLSLHCKNCNVAGFTFYTSSTYRNDKSLNFQLFDSNFYCNCCSKKCVTCETMWSESSYSSDYEECRDCLPRFMCEVCNITVEGEDGPYCEECKELICSSCGNYSGEDSFLRQHNDEGVIIKCCLSCYNSLEFNSESFDENSEMPATQLSIPTIEGRERIRHCGLEIEGINILYNAHNILARSFYDEGLSSSSERLGYHGRTSRGDFVHVERDSSCDWETVIGPINMASTEEVRKLNKVIRIIREHIKNRILKLTLSCGLHIHVSGEQVGLKQAHNLHLLYTYLEDVLYRLGAAKWPLHRAVVNGDESYRVSPRKIKMVNFAETYQDNRYYGLSFSNYFNQVLNNCGCGASTYGAYEECDCVMNKCTFEFRIFNTTANTKKIHAYTALTQALVAKALSMNSFDTEAMPKLQFNLQNLKDMNHSRQEVLITEWEIRMKYILEELPLTNSERDSIFYCVENSELETIKGYCERIINKNVEAVV